MSYLFLERNLIIFRCLCYFGYVLCSASRIQRRSPHVKTYLSRQMYHVRHSLNQNEARLQSQATLNTLQFFFFSFLTMSSCQFVFNVVRSIGRLVIAKRCKLCPKSVCGRNYIPINVGGKKLL